MTSLVQTCGACSMELGESSALQLEAASEMTTAGLTSGRAKGKGKGRPPSKVEMDAARRELTLRRQERAEVSKQEVRRMPVLKSLPPASVASPAASMNPLIQAILACSSVQELLELDEWASATLGTSATEWEWPIYVAHRVYLNDPTMDTVDFTGMLLRRDSARVSLKIAQALATNTHVERLLVCGTGFAGQPSVFAALLDALKVNRTLKVLHLDNLGIQDHIYLANAIAGSSTLEEVRCVVPGPYTVVAAFETLVIAELPQTVLEAFAAAAECNSSLRILRLAWPADESVKERIDHSLMRNAAAPRGQPATGAYTREQAVAGEEHVPTMNLVAQRTFAREDFAHGEIVEILPGQCWLLPALFTAIECDEMLAQWPSLRRNGSETSALRTNRRVDSHTDVAMACSVRERLPAWLLDTIEQTAPSSAVRGVFEMWRIMEYEPGQFFRAHVDDAYFRAVADGCGEAGEVSSHTVIVCLSDGYAGGETRFWPTGGYDVAVDVQMPKGGVMLFEQKDLLHEGRPILSGVKLLAQTGLLRAPSPAGRALRPVQFRWGPGITPVAIAAGTA
eukprot:NODE_2204_length_2267_cov_22.239720.p1 GENE.NODE_2204_length_2267_cov_22.239720~~NODE_2204_length_2267_cov_22.239720.p1  ORF type:complete len:565 (+),score=147.76 NODE_2204_length_2267_cov_22.239720:108-1802(+)